MLNQVQYHHAFVSGGGDMKLTPGGFQGELTPAVFEIMEVTSRDLSDN